MKNWRWPPSMNTGRRRIPIKEDMNMEEYEPLEMEVIEFEEEDVIATSSKGDLPGQNWP